MDWYNGIVLDKISIRKDFENGARMSALALKHGVSRQRIHQIVKNYTTMSPGWKKSKRVSAILDRGCEICHGVATIIHHRNGDTHYNKSENLMPLCVDCHYDLHIKIRESKNYKFTCMICKRESIVRFETPGLRRGDQVCENCLHWRIGQKHRKTNAPRLRQFQKSPNCKACGEPFTEQNPFFQHNYHQSCAGRVRYATNADFRERHAVLVRRWQSENPERWREISRKAVKRYQAKPENKLKARIRSREYYKKNKEKYAEYFHNAYLRRKQAKQQLAML